LGSKPHKARLEATVPTWQPEFKVVVHLCEVGSYGVILVPYSLIVIGDLANTTEMVFVLESIAVVEAAIVGSDFLPHCPYMHSNIDVLPMD
jgi:hypothetical protein